MKSRNFLAVLTMLLAVLLFSCGGGGGGGVAQFRTVLVSAEADTSLINSYVVSTYIEDGNGICDGADDFTYADDGPVTVTLNSESMVGGASDVYINDYIIKYFPADALSPELPNGYHIVAKTLSAGSSISIEVIPVTAKMKEFGNLNDLLCASSGSSYNYRIFIQFNVEEQTSGVKRNVTAATEMTVKYIK